MTNEGKNPSEYTQTTLKRQEHGTHLREAYWPFSGMRSLSTSFSDGQHRFALITHDDSKRRQSILNGHNIVELLVDPDDSLALCFNIRSEDDTPLTINLFGVTIDDLLEAVAKTVASRNPITEDSEA